MQSVAEVAFNSGSKPGPSQEGGKELGVVAGIFIGAAPGEPMHSVAEIKAIAGEGLEGDRKRLRGVPR
ncbi:MAG TPA: hypothetical protein VFL42_02015, partial [Terriglobales bacterium]|nr:hypothetical protein [Terriglobales bacterium]